MTWSSLPTGDEAKCFNVRLFFFFFPVFINKDCTAHKSNKMLTNSMWGDHKSVQEERTYHRFSRFSVFHPWLCRSILFHLTTHSADFPSTELLYDLGGAVY